MDNATLKTLVGTGGGLILGAGIATMVTNKLVRTKYEKLIDEEVQSVKDTYKLLRKEDEFSTPEKAAASVGLAAAVGLDTDTALWDDFKEIIDEKGYTNIAIVNNPIVEEEPVEQFDYDSEEDADDDLQESVVPEPVDQRDYRYPVVISADEFFQSEEHFAKITISYYEDDDVLADERDQIIPNSGATVGHDALTRFGEDSNDRNVVYVRNTKLATDFEVTRDPRSFNEVVLGIKPEKEFVRKMREDD